MAMSHIVLLLTLSAFAVSSLRFSHICPSNGEVVAPHPTSCSKYISCEDGIGDERSCQNGTHFNYELGICTDRNATKCDLCIFNTKPVLLLPFEGNCSKYIICYGMSRVERDCDDGLYFDAALGMCDQRENVHCEQNSNVAPSIVCRENVEIEYVPSLDTCEGYFICTNGVATAHNCSDQLIFNIVSKRCATTGRCLHDYVPICSAAGTYLPHLFDCRHYFYCEPDETEPLLQACRLGEFFDRSRLRCVPENEALCLNPPNEDLEDWPNTKWE